MNKKGQFYIMAAIIIVTIVLVSVGVKNYSVSKKQQSKVYDLGKELNLETGKVVDYGVVNEEDLQDLIKNWSKNYYQYASKRTQETNETYIFIYGNPNTGELTLINFSVSEIGTINEGGMGGGIQGVVMNDQHTQVGENGEVNITVNNITYNFKVKPGKNFYFVVSTPEATITSEKIAGKGKKAKKFEEE